MHANKKKSLAVICTAVILSLVSTSLIALEILNPEIIDNFNYERLSPDMEQGNLSASDFNELKNRKTITFENSEQFVPLTSQITLIEIPNATQDGTSQNIRFNALNKNWWTIAEKNKYMTFSGKQSLLLRGLRASPNQLYITFSQPVHYVAFVLCNMQNEEGDKVLFYKDAEGTELLETVEVKGKVKLFDGDVKVSRGRKIFIGVKRSEGIARIGFSFEKLNGNSEDMQLTLNSMHRCLDDLSFRIEP